MKREKRIAELHTVIIHISSGSPLSERMHFFFCICFNSLPFILLALLKGQPQNLIQMKIINWRIVYLKQNSIVTPSPLCLSLSPSVYVFVKSAGGQNMIGCLCSCAICSLAYSVLWDSYSQPIGGEECLSVTVFCKKEESGCWMCICVSVSG